MIVIKRKEVTMYPPIHEKKEQPLSYKRLDMLWERYPQFHEMTTFSTLDALLEEHESYRKDFDELREGSMTGSWSSCPGRIFLTAMRPGS